MIRFVNRKTGEEGKPRPGVAGSSDEGTLMASVEGCVFEMITYRNGSVSCGMRPDLRAEIVPDWIPVEERLPEKEDRYLVLIDGEMPLGDEVVWYQRDRRRYGDDERHWCTGAGIVTHWQPLPSTEVHRKSEKLDAVRRMWEADGRLGYEPQFVEDVGSFYGRPQAVPVTVVPGHGETRAMWEHVRSGRHVSDEQRQWDIAHFRAYAEDYRPVWVIDREVGEGHESQRTIESGPND